MEDALGAIIASLRCHARMRRPAALRCHCAQHVTCRAGIIRR